MAKIPVGATIAHAYQFTFGRFPDILRVVWIPILLSLVLSAFLQGVVIEMQQAEDGQLYGRVGQLLLMLLPAYLFTALLLFMQMEGTARLALGKLPEPGFYYLELGRPLWRLVGAMLLAGLILVGIGFAAALVVGIAGALFTMVSGADPQAGAGLSIILLTFAIIATLFYVMIRLTFLLTPSVVVQERIDLRQNWALAKGNVWRILVVQFATLMPLTLAGLALFFAFFGFPPLPGPDTDPAVTMQIGRDWEAAMSAKMIAQWYLFYPVSAVVRVLMTGLMVGAQCFAWQSLTQNRADA